MGTRPRTRRCSRSWREHRALLESRLAARPSPRAEQEPLDGAIDTVGGVQELVADGRPSPGTRPGRDRFRVVADAGNQLTPLERHRA